MTKEMNNIAATTKALRHRCIKAHNLLLRETGYSLMWEVREAIPVEFDAPAKSEVHLLLSSYAFWGKEEVGGVRTGFERRLLRFGEDGLWKLHQRMKLSARFGAWECVEVEEGESRWRPVGPGSGPVNARRVQEVTGAAGETEKAEKREVRVGWLLRNGPQGALLFSKVLHPLGAERLSQTAARNGWRDERADKIYHEEYERDVLTQMVAPGREECGLGEYYFLPSNLRRGFPRRFLAQLPREVARHFRTERGTPWHLYLAMKAGEEEEVQEELRRDFERIRKKAARSALSYYGRRVEPELLARLVSDEELFGLLGLDADGQILWENFRPVATHRLEVLGLDEAWFESVGLSPQATVQQAERELSAGSQAWEQFKRALMEHRRRLAWVSMVWGAEERQEGVELDYGDLYQVATEIFAAEIAARPLDEVIQRKAAMRIMRAMEEDEALSGEPVRVLHLPTRRYQLKEIRGVGGQTVEQIRAGLEAAMLSWGERFKSGGKVEEAKEEIDAGLEELAELFGS